MTLVILGMNTLHTVMEQHSFHQLKDADSAVLAGEKSTCLAELFPVELKFTIDTLNNWFSNRIKPTFFELDDIHKQIFIKENPIVLSETPCSICGFLLDVEAEGKHKRWYDFIVECEYLFLRNIYSDTDLQNMKIDSIEKYYEIFDRLVDLFLQLKVHLNMEISRFRSGRT